MTKIRFDYYDMLLSNVIDVKQIADIMLEPALELQNVSLTLIASNDWFNGITMECYNAGRSQEAKSYRLIGKSITKNI